MYAPGYEIKLGCDQEWVGASTLHSSSAVRSNYLHVGRPRVLRDTIPFFQQSSACASYRRVDGSACKRSERGSRTHSAWSKGGLALGLVSSERSPRHLRRPQQRTLVRPRRHHRCLQTARARTRLCWCLVFRRRIPVRLPVRFKDRPGRLCGCSCGRTGSWTRAGE